MQRVALAHRVGSQDRLARDHADEEPGDVVRARLIHAGHLRRLAAEQRAVVRGAGIGHRADDAREHRGIDPRRREVVEEEERLGAHRERVVHAVMHEVRADDLVPVEKPRELQLRADAVGRRDQDAVGARRGEEPTERRRCRR